MKLNLRLLSEVNTGTYTSFTKSRCYSVNSKVQLNVSSPLSMTDPCPKDMLKRPPNKGDQDHNAVKEVSTDLSPEEKLTRCCYALSPRTT